MVCENDRRGSGGLLDSVGDVDLIHTVYAVPLMVIIDKPAFIDRFGIIQPVSNEMTVGGVVVISTVGGQERINTRSHGGVGIGYITFSDSYSGTDFAVRSRDALR